MAVERFRGEHHFLSSMFELEHGVVVVPEGIVVPTVEHAYQAGKFADQLGRNAVLLAPDGRSAKRTTRQLIMSGQYEVRPEWDNIKLDVMRFYVTQKFARDPELAGLLVATGEEELSEGNTWGDRYWGVCPPGSGRGQNNLGRLLMETRFLLQQTPLPSELPTNLALPSLSDIRERGA